MSAASRAARGLSPSNSRREQRQDNEQAPQHTIPAWTTENTAVPVPELVSNRTAVTGATAILDALAVSASIPVHVNQVNGADDPKTSSVVYCAVTFTVPVTSTVSVTLNGLRY